MIVIVGNYFGKFFPGNAEKFVVQIFILFFCTVMYIIYEGGVKGEKVKPGNIFTNERVECLPIFAIYIYICMCVCVDMVEIKGMVK